MCSKYNNSLGFFKLLSCHLFFRCIMFALQEEVGEVSCVLRVPSLTREPWFVTLPGKSNVNRLVTSFIEMLSSMKHP